MAPYQRDFIDLAIQVGVLRFGDFTLKSGRQSPYFFNTGLFDTGLRLAGLADAYARCILDSGVAFDILYGPAYKGIPLACATSMALSRLSGADCPYAFNRKEAKDHGEGGLIVGRALAGRVLVIDDVITAGTSVRESVAIIRAAGAELAGVVIALDRQERGPSGGSAVAEVREALGCPVHAIVGLDQIIARLAEQPREDGALEALRRYRGEYGV
jgi:orotate phosphoribosyltransferase